MDAGARSRRIAFHDDQPAVDLLPPVHSGGILLTDKAALGETDAVQLGGIAFEPKQLAKLGAALAHTQPKPMLEPPVLLRRQKPRPLRSSACGAGLGPCPRRG